MMGAPSPRAERRSGSAMGNARFEDLIRGMDAANERACRAQREMLGFVAEVDRLEAWADDGARDMAQWLWIRYGISDWKARRWIAAAHALERLPKIAAAFFGGELGIDKVVELTRLATAETEAELIPWAHEVASGRIRHRGDVEARREAREAAVVDRDRTLSWWFFDEGRRFGLAAELP